MKVRRQRLSEARLAETGFARDQYDLAVARIGARLATQQQIDFLIATNQWA